MAAKFTYVGNPRNLNDQRDSIEVQGITFPHGEAVEVENEDIANKLRKNTHFVEDGKGGPKDRRTELAKANDLPEDPRATVAPVYRDVVAPRSAVAQGAGESGFGYNHEADEADRDLAGKARLEQQEQRRRGRPPSNPDADKTGLKRQK